MKKTELIELIKEAIGESKMINQKGYVYYVINTDLKKIVSGWENKEDAKDYRNRENRKNNLKLLSLSFIKNVLKWDVNDNKNWYSEIEEMSGSDGAGAFPNKYAFGKTDISVLKKLGYSEVPKGQFSNIREGLYGVDMNKVDENKVSSAFLKLSEYLRKEIYPTLNQDELPVLLDMISKKIKY